MSCRRAAHVDGVSKCGEYLVIAITDVTDDHFAAMDADPETDRIEQVTA